MEIQTRQAALCVLVNNDRFLVAEITDPRLNRGETLPLVEANGQRFKTLWRALDGSGEALPPLSPSTLIESMISNIAESGW